MPGHVRQDRVKQDGQHNFGSPGCYVRTANRNLSRPNDQLLESSAWLLPHGGSLSPASACDYAWRRTDNWNDGGDDDVATG